MVKVCVPRGDGGIIRMFESQDYGVVAAPIDADIIVFQGGSDINPALYGETTLRGTSYQDRLDQLDIGFFDYARTAGKPMIGICRGAQFLNVMNGGALWQDVNNHLGSHTMIDLCINHGSKLQVTSTHHQMMIPAVHGIELGIANLATQFKSAKERAKPRHDTEVVWYEDTRSLCVQFHPEYQQKICRLHFFDLVDHLIL